MQSFSELSASLGCTECESSFNSASLLLKHFAEHISQEALKDESNNDTFTYEKEVELAKHSWKKEKNESILEKALRSPLATVTKVGKLSSSRLSPAVNSTKNSSVVKESLSTSSRKSSVFTSPKTFSNNAVLPNSCAKAPGKNVLLEMPKRPKSKCSAIGNVMFVKLDLQKRLENCVLKLVRRDSSLVEESQSAFVDRVNLLKSDQNLSGSIKVSDGLNVPNGALTIHRENDGNEVVETSELQDDFNPLKFCVVTLEEGDEKLELNDEESSESYSPPPLYELTTCNVVPEKARKPMKCRNDNTKAITKLKRSVVSNGNGVVKPESSRKKYPCNYCSKQFGWSTDLKRHILTHTGERPFKCSLCSATFTRNFLLQKHIGKVHTGRFPSTKSEREAGDDIALPAKVPTKPSDHALSSESEAKVLNGDVHGNGEGVMFGDPRTLPSGKNGADCNGVDERLNAGKTRVDSEVVNGQKERTRGARPEQSRKRKKMVQEGQEDEEQRRRKKKKKKKVAGVLRNPLGTLVPISTNPLHTREGLNAKDPV